MLHNDDLTLADLKNYTVTNILASIADRRNNLQLFVITNLAEGISYKLFKKGKLIWSGEILNLAVKEFNNAISR